MGSDKILAFFAAAILYCVLLSVRQRREAILYTLRRLVIVFSIYFGVFYYLSQAGRQPYEAILAGVVVAVVADSFIPRRSRYVRSVDKRRAIARFELETGRKFNSKFHELDHTIPFSQGGSNTSDNLRVVDRKKNRSKGSKSPWWDLLGR